jgi:hypothetical protein
MNSLRYIIKILKENGNDNRPTFVTYSPQAKPVDMTSEVRN